MHAELQNWNNGWHGLCLSLRSTEITRLIELLQDLQRDPEQHFHISSDYAGEVGLGDIEISVARENEQDNLRVNSLAVEPDADMPSIGA